MLHMVTTTHESTEHQSSTVQDSFLAMSAEPSKHIEARSSRTQMVHCSLLDRYRRRDRRTAQRCEVEHLPGTTLELPALRTAFCASTEHGQRHTRTNRPQSLLAAYQSWQIRATIRQTVGGHSNAISLPIASAPSGHLRQLVSASSPPHAAARRGHRSHCCSRAGGGSPPPSTR